MSDENPKSEQAGQAATIEYKTLEELKDEHFEWLIDYGYEHTQVRTFEQWLEFMGIEIEPVPGPLEVQKQQVAQHYGHISATKYPWHLWTDGNEWEVRQGENFTCSMGSFRSYLYNYAMEHGLEVKTKRLSRREPLLWFQFRKANW